MLSVLRAYFFILDSMKHQSVGIALGSVCLMALCPIIADGIRKDVACSVEGSACNGIVGLWKRR
jgi:hypothetical protein